MAKNQFNLLGESRMYFWNKAKTKTKDWINLLGKRKSFDLIVIIDMVDDSLVIDGNIFVVGVKENYKWLKFKCPCGCGALISLNLMKSHFPRWTIKEFNKKNLTITPSVISTTCGSHFWIRKNKVIWV